MTVREIRATGLDALNLATELLQRCRLVNLFSGVFEAADVQWSWRKPRLSDHCAKIFWIDEDGPVAAILLSSSNDHTWQIDPVIVPDTTDIDATTVWNSLMQHIEQNPTIEFTIPISDDDPVFSTLARETRLHAVDQDSTGWMNAGDRPQIIDLREGFTLVDRTERAQTDHPMSDRNGPHIEERLNQCSLYDPSLDLSIETSGGDVAGYSLYWFDPFTKCGMIEPVRILDDFQRKGLARAMLSHGIDRLVERGAERIKVSWETEAAGALYLNAGFERISTTTWYSTIA